jgi:predicted neutral ceramidase superfamily lipid hydrolase
MIEEKPDNKVENKATSKSMIIVAVNVVILFIYTILLRTSSNNSDYIIAIAFLIALHFIISILIGIVCLIFKPLGAFAKGFLLSSLVVILVGFSTCYLSFSIH